MPSTIDATKTSEGQASTADMRENFARMRDEITDLQHRIGALEARLEGYSRRKSENRPQRGDRKASRE